MNNNKWKVKSGKWKVYSLGHFPFSTFHFKLSTYYSCLLFLCYLACSNIDPGLKDQSPGGNVLFAVTSDFSTGSYSTMSLLEPHESFQNLGNIHSDSVCKYNPLDNKIYILNRFGGDNIQVLEPNNNFQTIREFSLGMGSNPQDIAFYSLSKAFVSLYEKPYILVINPVTGQWLNKIDISAFADSDGLPEAHQLLLHNENGKTYLYLTLQRLNRFNLFKPTDFSLLLVIDPLTETVVNSLRLKGTNPNSPLRFSELTGAIHVSSVGNFGKYFLLDGGIETIRPASLPENTMVEDFLITEKELNGEIADFLILNDGSIFILISDGSFNSYLVKTNINTLTNREVLLYINFDQGGYLSGLISHNDEYLYISDTSPLRPGIWIYQIQANRFIYDAPVDLGLPPVDILVVP